MHKFPLEDRALITPLSPKISGHVSAGRLQPVCLRTGSFVLGSPTSTQRIVLVFSQVLAHPEVLRC